MRLVLVMDDPDFQTTTDPTEGVIKAELLGRAEVQRIHRVPSIVYYRVRGLR